MRIVIAKIGTDKTISYAVDELSRYLKMIDEALMVDRRIYSSYDPDIKGVIWVGEDKAFDTLLPDVSEREIDDAIYIDVKDSVGIVTGTNPRSVLIAVYRLLKELGCAWVRNTSDGEIIPSYTVNPFSVFVCESASYRHRGVCIEGSDAYEHVFQMIDWLPKAGMNAFFRQFMIPGEFFDRWYDHLKNPYKEKESVTTEDVVAMMRSLEEEIEKRGLLYHAVGHGWTSTAIGINSTGWEDKSHSVPDDKKEMIAEIGGERKYFNDMPLCTNLCYSNPRVQKALVETIVSYCELHPNTDYVHFWLADGANNFCECEKCSHLRPSDLYVDVMNAIDEALSEKGLRTRIVFLAYVDLLWAPVKNKLKNPDRFTIMFAPIKRNFDVSFKNLNCDSIKLPEYVLNKSPIPKDIVENAAHLAKWLESSNVTDGFDYDYHLMWNLIRDAGGLMTSHVLFDDMQNLDRIGLCGMVSCQLMRCSFPTGLAMEMMAEGLWDKKCDFEEKSDLYFLSAFGNDGLAVKEYLKQLTYCIDPNRDAWEFEAVSEEQKARLLKLVSAALDFEKVIKKNIVEYDGNIRRSWEYLDFHREVYLRFANALIRRADGASMDERRVLSDELRDFLAINEMKYHRVLDYNNSIGYFINSLTYYKGE